MFLPKRFQGFHNSSRDGLEISLKRVRQWFGQKLRQTLRRFELNFDYILSDPKCENSYQLVTAPKGKSEERVEDLGCRSGSSSDPRLREVSRLEAYLEFDFGRSIAISGQELVGEIDGN